MYLYAVETAQCHFDQLANYSIQHEAEKMYGKDMMYLRDAKKFVWEPEE
jgi:hypothetical protein